MQGIVVPSIVRENSPGQAVSAKQATQNIYNLKPSKNTSGAFIFNYKFAPNKQIKNSKSFDAAILPFDEKKAGLEQANFSPVRDAWGYPARENFYNTLPKEKTLKATELGKTVFGTGGAKNLDADPDNLGIYNCRADLSVTGYFKAYFEDVALNTNEGYDDQNFGQGRREVACQVLQDISELIMLDETDVTPDILFMANPDMPVGALAAASSYLGYYSVGPDNGSLHKHIISHIDPRSAEGDFDAFIMTGFNGIQWDVDSNLNPSTYSLYTVLYHETLHALGFRGLLPAVITSTNDSHSHDTFDYFSYKDNSLTNPFINSATDLLNVPTGAPSSWFTTNDVVYRGVKNVVGATPDNIVPIYSPTSWEQGSSLSHFDMNRAPGQTYVMHPSIGTNTERDIHEDEKEVLCHLGYMVNNMSGCEDPTPVAVDDMIVFEPGTPSCGKPITNDSPSFGGMLIKDMNPVTVYTGDSIIFRAGPNCQYPPLQAPPAKTFLFTSGLGSDPAPRAFKYTDFNATSPTARISFPAKIILFPGCEWLNDPYEYVCNGDFELGPTSIFPVVYGPGLNYGNHAFNLAGVSAVPYWTGGSSPDLATKNNSNYPFGPLNLPYNISDMLGQSHYAARMLVNNIDSTSYTYCEPISTELKEPLTAGQQYTLTFDIHGVLHESNNIDQQYYSAAVTPFFSNIDFLATTSLNACSLQDDSNITQILPSSPVIPLNISDWTPVEYNFIANGNHSFLTLSPRRAESIYDYYSSRTVYIDNVSIRPINAPPPPPPPPPPPTYPGQINGTLYHDLNQNGSQQVSAETGLSGVQVGLFQSGNLNPIQIITTQDIPNLGKYEFENLADGTYYVALIGESVYPVITQPGISNEQFLAYNHMYTVSLNGGQVVGDKNFGVLLSNNETDIQIKKTLIDPTLSLFDRYITWRIIVQNIGPNNATNILIKEIIPAGLVYHSNVTPIPNGYDSSAHMLSIPALSAGGQTYIDITMKVPNSKKVCGTKTNLAVLHHLDQTDTNLGNNQGQASILLPRCPIVDAPSQVGRE
jgi:uncharacterized repeat protein (TIGR01451 family)